MTEGKTQERPLGELLVVDAHQPVMEANFDQLEAALEERLSRYQTIVTADGVKEAKAAATEINKLATRLDERRREVVSEVSTPIREFEDRMKRLRDRAKEARQGLLDQCAKFDEEQLERARALITSAVSGLFDELGVRPEFQRASCQDLAKLSALTPKGDKLTKGVRDKIVAAVNEDLRAQERVDRRSVELENRCYRAGLSVPLSVDNVRHVIEADDETYATEVDRLIDAEFSRQQELQRIERERAERRAKAEASAPEPEEPPADDAEPAPPPEDAHGTDSFAADAEEHAAAQAAQTMAEAEEVAPPSPEPPVSADGYARMVLTATFVMELPRGANPQTVAEKLHERLRGAGFQSVAGVTGNWMQGGES